MVRIAVFVNEISSTSIPVETAIKTHNETASNVILVSYYDDSGAKFDPDIQQERIPTVCLGAESRFDYNAYRMLRRLCIERDIDLLHTHHNSTGSLGRLAVIGTDTGVVNTEHNDHEFFSHLQKSVNSITYPLTDVIIHNSQNTADSLDWYEKILSKWSREGVIYNGIDKGRVDSAKNTAVDLPDGPIITTPGRLVDQKNHASLLQAFELIEDRHANATLVIVGDGPLRGELETLSHELGIQDSVVFTGYLPRREDVYGVLKNSTIGVFSSWYEGFCVAAVEAMAAGLPIVVSDIAVLREVVGEPALFADPNDPASFADAVSSLLEDSQKRNRLAVAGKERARSNFTLERTAREYCNIYKEVAETPNQ